MISRATIQQIALYGSIGIVVAAVDFSVFNVILARHSTAALATTIAYTCGVSTHFLLNRFINFRNFERTIVQQARTYTIIVILAWFVTLAVVECGIRLGFAAFPSRVVAAIINFPLGYISHRYLTFGPGIAATLRRELLSRSRSPHE